MNDDLPSSSRRPASSRAGSAPGRWVPPSVEHLNELLPAYDVLSILGQGGMGAVYRARQKLLDRMVAIKILPPEIIDDENADFVERFKNEARTMAKMNHPGIVAVYDFGETAEGQLYIVMEFVDGTDVQQMIKSQGKLPADYALAISAHVCDALQYAHSHGVIHRDIKPANILINMEGQIKVADFGLAKASDPEASGITKTNMAMGTPDFVAPEVLISGMFADQRADLYAVGVMLYNMLTGNVPRGMFKMPSIMLPGTDPRFDAIIAKAMETDRDHRYQSAYDVRTALDRILTTPHEKEEAAPAAVPAAPAQKPVAQGPRAPQLQSAGAPAQKPVTATTKKSNTGMIIGIAAAVVVVAAFFMVTGAKQPAAESIPVAEAKEETAKLSSKPATPNNKPAATPAKVDGIVTFGGHRYQLLTDWFKWPDAKAKAEAMGGHLVTINSKAESSFVRDTFLPKVFGLSENAGSRRLLLGGRQMKDKGPWQWVTGEPFDATLWAGQRNDDDVKLHFLAWDYGAKRWMPVSSQVSYLALVEWDGEGTAVPPTGTPMQTLDLLGLTDPVKDRLPASSADKNEWGHEGAALIYKADGRSGMIAAPVALRGRDYEIELLAERLSGTDHLNMDVPLGNGHSLPLCLNSPDTKVINQKEGKVWGKTGSVVHASVRVMLSGDSLSDRIVIQRKDTGETVTDWTGDLGKLGTKSVSYPAFPGQPVAALFMFGKSPYAVKTWRLRVFDGEAKVLREAVSTTVTVAANPTTPVPKVFVAPAVQSTPASAMPAPAPASQPVGDARLARLESGFKTRYEADAQKPFLASLTTLNQSYIANGITRARAAAQAKGNLTEITALDKEKAAIEKGEGVPPDDDNGTSEGLKTLRSTYRAALAKLTAERDTKAAPLYDLYLRALDAYVTDLTKANKIDEAQKVKALRDDIATRKVVPEAPVVRGQSRGESRSVRLFDGKSLQGWTVAGDSDAFVVDDGAIKATGAGGNLVFTGAGKLVPPWKDVDLTPKVKTGDKGNSGVWVHCPVTPTAERAFALEVQLLNSGNDSRKTASIYNIEEVPAPPVQDNEWFDLRITVRHKMITVYVNGTKASEWKQPAR